MASAGAPPTQDLWEMLLPIHDAGGEALPATLLEQFSGEARRLCGGITMQAPQQGHWVSPQGELISEPMLPVRLATSEETLLRLADYAAELYDQQAIMVYRVSSHVLFVRRGGKGAVEL